MRDFDALTAAELLDLSTIARVMGYAAGADALDAPVSPRGYRLLAKVPRLPNLVVDRLVEHFGGLQKLLAAGIDDLQAVEGVGETQSTQRARGALATGRVVDPRALRLTAQTATDSIARRSTSSTGRLRGTSMAQHLDDVVGQPRRSLLTE